MARVSPGWSVKDAGSGSRQSGSHDAGGRRNTLGLSPRELESMLDILDSSAAGEKHQIQRAFTRWRFRLDNVKLAVVHPGGSISEFPVVCRNLSCGGIGVLHGSFVHPGSAVRVHLPHPSKGEVVVEGTIRRCLHRGGRVHDVGVEFNTPLSAREFVGLDLLIDSFSREHVDAPSLTGTVLHVEPQEVDRSLMKHFLRDTSIKLEQVEDGSAALIRLSSETDLVLISDAIEHPNPSKLVSDIRARGSRAALAVITANQDPETKTAALAMRLDALLPRPLDHTLLLQAVAEFTVDRDTRDTSTDAEPMAGGVPARQRLGQFASDLGAAAGLRDVHACISLCEQIQGVANMAELHSVSTVARDAAEELTLSKSIEKSIASLLGVISACQDEANQRAA